MITFNVFSCTVVSMNNYYYDVRLSTHVVLTTFTLNVHMIDLVQFCFTCSGLMQITIL